MQQAKEGVSSTPTFDGLDVPGRQSTDDYQTRDLNVIMENGENDSEPSKESDIKENVNVKTDQKSPSCFTKLKKVMWSTKLLMDETSLADPNKKASVVLRELFIYSIYLALLSVISLAMMSVNTYFFTQAVKHAVLTVPLSADNSKTFYQISTTDDFWAFAEGPLISGLYSDWETYYNDEAVHKDELGYVFYNNFMLGVPRIRQLKVINSSCTIHADFQEEIKDCFAAYSPAFEEKKPFGKFTGTAWEYRTEKELNGTGSSGQLTTYSGAGYYANLGNNSVDSAAIIADLKQNLWIDRATRAVIFDFSLYNANVNLFCIVRLYAEFPPTGGIITSSTIRTVKLIQYVSTEDYVVFACQMLFAVFILYYIVEEILEIKIHKFKYFQDIYNLLDILIIVISIVCIAFNMYRYVLVNDTLSYLLADPTLFADFEFLSYWSVNFNYVVAIVCFLSWIKLFKYLSFNKTMTQLTKTIARAKNDLVGFVMMFMIALIAFAQLGYLLFGPYLQKFSTTGNALLTLFRCIIGDFVFQELEETDIVFGPLYFLFFVFFIFFVFLNMFLAIINDAYSDVKKDIASAKNEIEMGEYFKENFFKVLDKLNIRRKKIETINKALQSADKNLDKVIDMKEFKTILLDQGFKDEELAAVFKEYDLNHDQSLDLEEQQKIKEDLEKNRVALAQDYTTLMKITSKSEQEETTPLKEEEIKGVTFEEFTVLSKRVNRLEISIGIVVQRMDAVLVLLNGQQKTRPGEKSVEPVALAEWKRDLIEWHVNRELEGKSWDSYTEERCQ